MTVRRFVRRRSAETPLSKRALMKRGLLEHNNYLRFCTACRKQAWSLQVTKRLQWLVNNLSKYQSEAMSQ